MKLRTFKKLYEAMNTDPEHFESIKNSFGTSIDKINSTSKTVTVKITSNDRYGTLKKIESLVQSAGITNAIVEPKQLIVPEQDGFRKYIYLSKPLSNQKIPAENFEGIVCAAHNLSKMGKGDVYTDEDVRNAISIANVSVSNIDDFIDKVESFDISSLSLLNDINENLRVMGRSESTAKLTKEWEDLLDESGASVKKDKTPKTDIVSASNKFRISVKKGPAQLLSAGAAETYATFFVAIKENNDDVSDEILNSIITNMKKFKHSSSINDIKKLTPSEMDSIQKEIFNSITDNKELKQSIITFLKTNHNIKKSVIKEAMTGNYKFGNNIGSANYILLLNDSGTAVTDFSKINDAVVSKYAEAVKIDLAFKASGKNKWSSFRLITDSVIQNVCDEIINEGLMDTIKSKINSVKEFFAELINRFIKAFEQMKDKLINLFDFNVKITID